MQRGSPGHSELGASALLKAEWWDLRLASLLTHLFLLRPAGVATKYFDEYVCLCVCLSARTFSGTTRAIFTEFLCMLPMSVARSSIGTLTIGRIACRREGGYGSAQRGRSVIYDCLVSSEIFPFLL